MRYDKSTNQFNYTRDLISRFQFQNNCNGYRWFYILSFLI